MSLESYQVRVPAPGAAGQEWEVAATLYFPRALSLASGPDLLFLLPGAGYSRGYFDLPVEGFSQAAYHAGRGNIVVTLDYIGTGESSLPEDATWADAAASTHNAVTYIAEELAQGRLLDGIGPVRWGALVGAGQSLGGHLIVATQAQHGTFKGIATLGSSIAGTAFPTRDGGKETDFTKVDFAYGFHWDEVPAVDASTTPTDLATLIGVDLAIGCPMRTAPAPWASQTVPAYVGDILAGDTPKANAARVESPVLLIAGERDVTLSPEEEAAPFTNAAEVATFTLPESAHMHNFAQTREQLWKRLDTFVMHASTFTRKIQSTILMELMQQQQEEAERKAAEMAAAEKG